jgi:surface antigen
MKIKATVAAAALALVTLAGCAQDQYQAGPKQTIGAVGGAILGGIAGAQFGKGTGRLIATGVGTGLGLLVGSEIGRSLDDLDRRKAAEAQQAATTAPIGQTIVWNNPQSGNSGSVTPVRDGYRPTSEGDKQYCREFQEKVTVGGKTQDAYGIACRQPDGSWEIQ